MEEGLTRKEFFTAAAAVGAAAFIPTATAMADPGAETGKPGEDAGQSAADADEPVGTGAVDAGRGSAFAQMEEHMEVEQGAESLAGTAWAELAPMATDVVKSYNGYHMMNQPGYFAFTGWDTVHDQPMDMGIAFKGDPYGGAFIVKAKVLDLYIDGKSGEQRDWVIAEGASGIWRYQKWASGKFECWGKTGNLSVGTTAQALGSYYSSYASVATIPSGWFTATPQIWINYSLNSNGLLNSVNTWALNTSKTNIGITCMSNAHQTGLLLVCDFHCIGRWK